MITIGLNGKEHTLEGSMNILQLLEKLGLQPQTVAVELNCDVIRKHLYKDTVVNAKDQVEILTFMGGG